MKETKKWSVAYDHNDGRKGTVNVVTEVQKVANTYGNGKYGKIIVDGYDQIYDLRYNHEKDLHRLMIDDYFGSGIVSVTEN